MTLLLYLCARIVSLSIVFLASTACPQVGTVRGCILAEERHSHFFSQPYT